MKLSYNKDYWDNYYNGTYEETFRFSFNAKRIVSLYKQGIGTLPQSFADIGAGPGHTLKDIEQVVPGIKVYGVECQDIPKERVVSDKVKFADFMACHKELEKVDLLYCSCSMYIPWHEQEEFLKACLALSGKAVFFGNVYLSDRSSIPEDSERIVVYKSRQTFVEAIEGLGGWRCISPLMDFFIRTSNV